MALGMHEKLEGALAGLEETTKAKVHDAISREVKRKMKKKMKKWRRKMIRRFLVFGVVTACGALVFLNFSKIKNMILK